MDKMIVTSGPPKIDIPILSLGENLTLNNLKDGIPEDNEIIAESIRLYEQEIRL